LRIFFDKEKIFQLKIIFNLPNNFNQRYAEWAPIASKQVDDSINRFLMKNRIKLQRREPEVIFSGR